MSVKDRYLNDGVGTPITSTTAASKQPLDVILYDASGNAISFGSSGEIEVIQDTHDDLNCNANIQIGDTDVDVSNPVPIQGIHDAADALTAKPVAIGGRDLVGQIEYLGVQDLGGGIAALIMQQFDAGLNSPDFTASGENYDLVGSTDGTKTNANYILLDSGQRVRVVGAADDNAAAVGSPVRAATKHNSAQQTYSDGDVADLQSDDAGYLHQSVRRNSVALTGIDGTYDNVTTTNTSASFDVRKFRRGLFYSQVTESGAATDIEFTLQYSHDDTNWYDYRHGPWVIYRFDDATIANYGTLLIAEPFECVGSYIRMIVTASGTTASDTFTVANSYFEVMD